MHAYLDANAGAPIKPKVRDFLAQFAQGDSRGVFAANPSSIHFHGRKAKALLDDSRLLIARSLGQKVDPERLIFTSSGTESNQQVIRSILARREKPHWLVSAVEHDSVLQLVPWVRERGGEVDFIDVDRSGSPLLESLNEKLRHDTSLVSCIWVNNETGVISPVVQIAQTLQVLGIPLHLDGAQAWGKLPLELESLGAQFVTFSGHKIGAPAGVGLIWLQKGMGKFLDPLLLGKQEKGRRAGTENLLGITALGIAATDIDPLNWASRVRTSRDRLEAEVLGIIAGVRVNGADAPRVGNTSNFSFEGIEGDGLVMALDLEGFSASAGSACSSGVVEPSHVLLAMGLSRGAAMGALRISLAQELDNAVLDRFCDALLRSVDRVREAGRRRVIDEAQESGYRWDHGVPRI